MAVMPPISDPHGASGKGVDPGRVASTAAGGIWAARPRTAAVAVVAFAAGAAAIVAWRAGEFSGQWRSGFALGVVFLAMAALLSRAVLAGSRRDLAAAEQLLNAATGDLADAYERLRETSRARDDALARLQAATRDREIFLATVAHDLKSPLTVIKGHTDLLVARTASGNPVDAGRIAPGLARIAASTEQLMAMIDELLWLAQLGIDRAAEQHSVPTDLVALARQVIEAQVPTAPRHRLRFDSSVPAVVGAWDPARLERVLSNLLSNAVKYSPGGGEVRTSVSAEDNGATAVLTVADDGIGIPAVDLPHVFERFFRAENVQEGIPGTGVGLASVRQIVQGMGGTVAVDSREGVGTTVTVRIPIHALATPGS